MTRALPCWIIGCPLSVSVQLSFHSLPSLLSLCQSIMSFRRCLLKLSLSHTRTTQTLLQRALPLSLSLFSLVLPSSFHRFWEQFTLLHPPPLLLIHPPKACRRATLLLSVSLHPPGFRKSPQRLEWFTGWPSCAASKGLLAQFLLYISATVISSDV